MQVSPSTFTIAEYCDQMTNRKIIVNRDYQRSPKVWPPAAKSYLIDTILLGFPISKLSLYQSTDLKSRQTIKEIVDGQQRSQTILSFYRDEFRISGKSQFAGKKYSQLEDIDQAKFLDYQLSVDVFVGATPAEIRQVFRRMNSYTVPLNDQEKRHAVYQGAFKWFMVDVSEKYAQVLKDIGVFSESQLSRMADVSLLAEIVIALFDGITSQSQKKITDFYGSHDDAFDEGEEIGQRLDDGFRHIIEWQDIHNTAIMKSYHFYTLMLAILHCLQPVPKLQSIFQIERPVRFERDIVLANLGTLAEALEQPDEEPRNFDDFFEASSAATTRIKQRQTRFIYFCRALQPQIL